MPDTLKVANTFNKYFVNIGNIWKIHKSKRFLVETNNVFGPVLRTIKKHSAHPSSILNIRKKVNNMFSFRNGTYEKILNEHFKANTVGRYLMIMLFFPILSCKTLTTI